MSVKVQRSGCGLLALDRTMSPGMETADEGDDMPVHRFEPGQSPGGVDRIKEPHGRPKEVRRLIVRDAAPTRHAGPRAADDPPHGQRVGLPGRDPVEGRPHEVELPEPISDSEERPGSRRRRSILLASRRDVVVLCGCSRGLVRLRN
jgi:hypothetical protein